MNTSKLIEMWKEDNSIFKDVDAFLKYVNEPNIKQTVRVHTQVVDEERIVSFAEMNGGPCTARDIDDAMMTIKTAALTQPVLDSLEKVKSEIASGDIATTADLKARLQVLL